MAKMFEEKENHDLKEINDWYRGYFSSYYQNVSEKIWVNRFECSMCKKNEHLDDLEKRFNRLIDHLNEHNIILSEAEIVSKFANALPVECDEFLENLKRNIIFSKLPLYKFISKLKTHRYDNERKKKELMTELEKNLKEISLNVLVEIRRRFYECLAAKRKLNYDMKRGCYIDENMNPFDFVKLFCAGTYKM
ncbi:hypothetical protein Hanom_Chr07g00598541 [Helianthus anomalus]